MVQLAVFLSLGSLLCGVTGRAGPAAAQGTAAVALAGSTPAPRPLPSIAGRIVDPSGVGIAGAALKLTGVGEAPGQEAISDNDGRFVFANATPGPFHLIVTAAGFATQEFSGSLAAENNFDVPQITLSIAEVVTEVKVVPPQLIAEAQIKDQEKQKALGFIPNFYVTYVPNAVALAPRQKFELAWKTMIDPVTFGITGAVAGLQQANNDFSGYGQGAQGYAKRYGAAYADMVTSTLIGGALFPSLFKQDPRYFYKGTGSKRSRLLYALANSVICKGDNGHWQANYSALLGSLAAGGISNLYYPPKDRDAGLTLQNALIGLGATAAANVLQEFVVKKLTPNLPAHDPASGKSRNLVGKAFGSLVHSGD